MELPLSRRIIAFVELGDRMEKFPPDQFLELAIAARNRNSWFTLENVRLAWNAVRGYLQKDQLEKWLVGFDWDKIQNQNVGVVMAGNIPLVGFHDFLSVLLTGHSLHAKLSSDDTIIFTLLIQWLKEISPELAANIHLVERLNGVDAVIATGSNNTSRYFEYYFKDIPHIIRKNRTSIAILDGSETSEEIRLLGDDIFTYFGLGCRNVSKIYVPKGFDFVNFIDGLESHSAVIHHHKYNNNYDYNKSIYLVNGEHFLDNGFLLVKESKALSSPVSFLFFKTYESATELSENLLATNDQIQCIVSKNGIYPESVAFGEAQQPALNDYADGVNTLEFLWKVGRGL
jgi:hypothetical protein